MIARSTPRRLVIRGVMAPIVVLIAGLMATAEPDPAARRAIDRAAPSLPADVVAALQEGRFEEAIAGLDRKDADPKLTPDEKSYDALIRGIAQRLAGRLPEARAALSPAIAAAPNGPWAAKLRSELTSVELAAGRFDRAEALAKSQAETLLADARKDRLAGVYESFARRLLHPADPAAQADPEAAYALLAQARELAKGNAMRGELLLAMAEASQKAGNPARAIQNFQLYLAENPGPRGNPRRSGSRNLAAAGSEATIRALYGLGESQLLAGMAPAARLTWNDLARDLVGVDTPLAAETRAETLFGIATTYGIPAPPDDNAMNLGIGWLRRLIDDYPGNRQATMAGYQIGESYLARGKSQEALSAFEKFLARDAKPEGEEARREAASMAMSAQFQVAKILQGRGNFAGAVAAYRGYLAKFPDGPQGADAQRAILDVQVEEAADHLNRKRFDQARAAWSAFVAANPLDGRVPQVLFEIGESFSAEKKFSEAIAAWESLANKFPASEPAAHGQYRIGEVFEVEKADPSTAIDRYRKVANIGPWKANADQKIAAMESKQLAVITPRAFRSGESAYLEISTRNVETLTFTAYKIDPEAYFRKKHAIADVESLDVGLVAPDSEWKAPVPGFKKYAPIAKHYELKTDLKFPGVYVVKVTDEKTLQAATLVLGSDVDAIVKASQTQFLVFAQDMKTGRGRAGARVIVAQGNEIVLEGKTGEDGVLIKTWESPRPVGMDLSYLVLDGANVAGSGLSIGSAVAQGLTPRAYLATDRPAYRPGQVVELRGVVREVVDGQYSAPGNASYRLEIIDSRGRRFVSKDVTLSQFGTFHETIPVDAGAPVGSYQMVLSQPGKSQFAGAFQVRAYQLEKVALEIRPEKPVVFRGDVVKAEIEAKYQYGTPLSGRLIFVRLPDGRTLSGETDALGKFAVEFPTEGFAEEQKLAITAQLPRDNVAASAEVALAIRGFRIDLGTARDVYLDGESFPLSVATLDPLNQPTGRDLEVIILKRVEVAGGLTEREVKRLGIKTDPTTGLASIPIKIDDRDGGPYVLRVAGTDQFRNPIVADRALTISGKKDETTLRLLADRQDFKVGETASVRLFSRDASGTALVAWEADRILKYRIVSLKEGENPLSWEVEGVEFPNFSLAASRMSGSKFDEARLDVKVVRDLTVTVTPKEPKVAPGEEIEVEVSTVDQLGRPVAAEVALALVDRSLLRLFADNLPPIGTFFHARDRVGAFATESTNTFRYAPRTVPVPEAVVEEQERRAAMERDMKNFQAVDRDQVTFGLNLPRAPSPTEPAAAPAPADAAPPAGAMGGMRGGTFDSLPAELDKAEAKEEGKVISADSFREQKEKYLELPVLAKRAALGRRMFAAEQPRQRFVETAYWNPSVVTGKDGKATVKFRAPTALSEYRFTGRGVTGSDTLAGQGSADLAVRKPFFVDLKAPAALTQGDKPRFLAQVHHSGVKGMLALRLDAYAGERTQVYPKMIELKGDGVEEVLFEPFEVPDGESVRLTLKGTIGEISDEMIVEVPIRPWGVQAMATASGSSSVDATAIIGLPETRAYESPDMLVVVSPTTRRMLIELALGRDAYVFSPRISKCILPPPIDSNAVRASDLLAATSALQYLRSTRTGDAPEASRLSDRITGLVAELTSAQSDDDGWPWVIDAPGTARAGERLTSARVFWALASAESLGVVADLGLLDRATNYLTAQFATIDAADTDARAAVLHALATRKKATFEAANALNRSRQNLSDAALAYLALTFAELDRASIANEVLGILASRAKTEAVEPGGKPRRYWEGSGRDASASGPVEATALAALAFSRVRPQAPELPGAVEWLLAHRLGAGWQPETAKGAALAALSAFFGQAKAAEDRYRLVVTVNDVEIYKADVAGAAEGKAVVVPRRVLKAGGKNRVHFDIEGRGEFGYSVLLSGFTRDFKPDQDGAGRSFVIGEHNYTPADPEFDGRTLKPGFQVVQNPTIFRNLATQVPLGGRVRVEVSAWRNERRDKPEWDRDFLVLEEHLPAGTSLVEGSIVSAAERVEVGDGTLTFYFPPPNGPGMITYEVFGALPGQYRVLPSQLRSAYDPGRHHLGPEGNLRVLAAGEPSTDPYKPTPDELFSRGKALFDAARFAEAATPLEALWGGYTLREDIARDASRMLLSIHIKEYDPRKVVQYFEVLKEKSPELVIPFDDIRVVGRAYGDIGEHERAYLVWRAVVEASYLEDARVGEVLRQKGETLQGIALLLDLWREHPNSASIESDLFGLSQLLASLADKAIADPKLRRELAEAGVTKSDLLLQAIRLVQVFLAQSPKNPMADEASLAIVGSFLELEDFESVVKLSGRYAKLYPKSTFLDGFQYSEALGRFHLGQYDRAIELAESIARATYKDASGVDRESPNKWQALYILGQIYDARRKPAEAVAYYRRVADRFSDAADAVTSYTKKGLKLPEVTVAAGPGKPEVKLEYRNIAEADVKVYPVDLMRLYLSRRSLDGIAGIDLAGITPLLESKISLGDGSDFEDKVRAVPLPLEKEGAYLLMVRGDNLFASGIVLVTPLKLEVAEEAGSGRVRVTVRDAASGDFVPKVQVKVLGSDNPAFLTGETDLRGVFVAEGVRGQVTAVARRGSAQYAFHRGTIYVGTPSVPNTSPLTPSMSPMPGQAVNEGKPGGDSLEQNLRQLNDSNRARQIDRLNDRYGKPGATKGVQVQQAR